MNRIKQMLCIALVFVFAGGCAQVKKTEILQTETTLASEPTQPAETTLTAVNTYAQLQEETTATTRVTTEVHTERSTTTRPTTVKQTTKVVTTKAETTAKVVETTEKTTQPTTASVPEQSEDGVVIGLKRMIFGSGKQDIISVFGNPTETVTEKLNSGGTVTSLVYADDYSEFAVFQLLNGKFMGFYTCVRDTLVTDGKKSYSIRTGGENHIGDVWITEYADSKKGGSVYAFKANCNGFNYSPAALDGLDGQERLIYHTTNALRAINGVSPLGYSDKAAGCILKHCKDMSARNYFEHDTPEGVTSAQRMRNSGIEYTSCGENLAAGFQDAFGMTDGWYNSSGHRMNLLDKNFRYVGVGVAEGNEHYDIYAGQNFYG